MSSLYYHEFMGKIEEHEPKKYLMVGDYMLLKEINKIKMIVDIERFDYTKILTEEVDKLLDDVIFKSVALLFTCVIKDDYKFYPQILLEEALVA